jgi:hypothetical protein
MPCQSKLKKIKNTCLRETQESEHEVKKKGAGIQKKKKSK